MMNIYMKNPPPSYTGNNGRLGNQIIRNLAVSLLARRHNLAVYYYNKELIAKLGIELFSGSKTYNKVISLTDDNYGAIYNTHRFQCNINPNDHYFQTKQITNFLYAYLSSIQSAIIDKNPYKERYNENNDLFIHIRLTDVARFNPGLAYYVNAIGKLTFDKLYISTDEATHPIIKELVSMYPTITVIQMDEIHTIQFASTCKHIVLSHGSFSAVIGYLAFFSNVYYPAYGDTMWYGDMFSIDGWKKLV